MHVLSMSSGNVDMCFVVDDGGVCIFVGLLLFDDAILKSIRSK